MSHEPYSSLMRHKNLIFNGRKIKVYDCRPQRGKYVYRDVGKKKYTPIDEARVEKCMAKIENYLDDQFPAGIESEECRKACKQPKPRFDVAVLLLCKFEKKVLKHKSAGKEYLRLAERKKRKFRPPQIDESIIEQINQLQTIQVPNSRTISWLEETRKKQKRRAVEEYRQRRETYNR